VMKCKGCRQPLVFKTQTKLPTLFICGICHSGNNRDGSWHCKACLYDVCPDCYNERDLGKFQIFLNRLPRRLGKFLQRALHLSWALHLHLFLCCVFPCIYCVGIYRARTCIEYSTIAFSILSMFTTPFVVTLYLINEVGDFYPEVQSWQVSYCVWGCSCGVLSIIGLICKEKGIVSKFQNWILWPFGISVSNDAHTSIWAIPLVSVAVSIVGGFVANYALEQRFLLNCGSSYSEGMCYHDVCCQPVGSHQFVESGRFVGDFASNILAAWGVVKGLAYFIVTHDKSVRYEDSAGAKFKEMYSKHKGDTETALSDSINQK